MAFQVIKNLNQSSHNDKESYTKGKLNSHWMTVANQRSKDKTPKKSPNNNEDLVNIVDINSQ